MRMTFNIPFIQASRRLTGVDSNTILEIKKIRETGRGYFASVLIARQNGEEFVLKKYFVNIESKKEKKFQKNSKF